MESMIESIDYRLEKLHWIIRIILYFICLCFIIVPVSILFFYIDNVINGGYFIMKINNYVIIILTSIIVILIFEKSKIIPRLGFEKGNILKKYSFGFLLGSLLIIASSLPSLLFFSTEVTLSSNVSYKIIFAYFLFFIIQGAGEEILVRGLFFPIIVKDSKPITALIVTSIGFGSLHLGNSGLSFIGMTNLILGGFIFGYLVLYYDSLWQACAFHTSWNFIQGNILGFKVSGTSVDSLIQVVTKGDNIFTGGDFGVEGSIFSLIVLIITIIYYHKLCEKKGLRIFKKTI